MYYAELETDKIIRENFFSDFNYIGTMVEVGCGPPEFLSMSKHFRDYGWRCICIDPNPKFVNQHKEKNHEIYEYAISKEEKDDIFNIVNTSWDESVNGISYSSLNIKYDLTEAHSISQIPVKTIKLNTLLNQIDVKKVDFLSVDTEGFELEVMQGFDPAKYDTKIILLENFLYKESYVEYMNKIGFELIKKINYNYIFKKNE
jgi:FkbM family methyltransferase